jgi:hypothetical protein
MVPASLWAQDVPKVDVFGGFSVLTLKSGSTRTTPVGWQAAISGNVNEMFSLVGDFGGQYKDGGSALEYLGGPRVTKRSDKTAIFGHALFGGTHFNNGGGNHFTMGFGGGVDVAAGDNFAIRVVQFDWLPTKGTPTWLKNNLRFGFGVVWKSGS